jgi:hypothetical protein
VTLIVCGGLNVEYEPRPVSSPVGPTLRSERTKDVAAAAEPDSKKHCFLLALQTNQQAVPCIICWLKGLKVTAQPPSSGPDGVSQRQSAERQPVQISSESLQVVGIVIEHVSEKFMTPEPPDDCPNRSTGNHYPCELEQSRSLAQTRSAKLERTYRYVSRYHRVKKYR